MRIHRNPDHSDANDDAPRMAVFMRGLTIGALVGAAIAGSALWERARRRGEHESLETEHEPLETEVGPTETEPGLEPELTGSNSPPADG